MTEFNANLKNLFLNYKNQQNYKNLEKLNEETKQTLDLNGDGKVNYKDMSLMNANEKRLLKTNNIFDFNNNNETNFTDLFFIQGGIDIDGDGIVDEDELAFIANYKNAITTEIYNNLKKDKTLTINDLLMFETEISKMSDADKKTWKAELKKLENQIITNLKANTDMNSDGKTDMADLSALWSSTGELKDVVLFNGKKLDSVLSDIQSKMVSNAKKAGNLSFDFNGDGNVNVNDITTGDLDGDGKVSALEQAFIKSNKSAIYNQILSNIKANKSVTVNDLLEFENAIATMSEEDKKSWKSYLTRLENQIITNLKANTDMNSDGKTDMADLSALWSSTGELKNVVLFNGKKLDSVLSDIQNKMVSNAKKTGYLSFDFNGDGNVNVNDITTGDLDGDGKVSALEQAFIKSNKSAIYNQILSNIKANKSVTVNDLLEFENAIATMSEEDKKTWKSYLSNLESNLINNISKNTDILATADGTNTKDDLKEFWKLTYNLNGSTVLANGRKLSSILNSIESKIMTAIMKENNSIKKADLLALKETSIAELIKNGGQYDVNPDTPTPPSTPGNLDPITPAAPKLPEGTVYELNRNLESIMVNGKEIKLDIGNLNSYIFGKIVVDDAGKIYVHINDDASDYCRIYFETSEDLDIEIVHCKNDNFVLAGGSGNDKITTAKDVVMSEILGCDGDDTIINNGTIGKSENYYGYIYGGDGNDTIINNGTVHRTIDAGDGDDTITNNGTIDQYIQGGEGDDTIIISENTTNKDLKVNGNAGDDKITNYGIVSSITGGEGDDFIQNFGETSVMWGDDGNDTIINEVSGIVSSGINGDSGDDTLINRGVVGSENSGGYVNGSYGNDNVINEGVAGGIVSGGGDEGDNVAHIGRDFNNDRVSDEELSGYKDYARDIRKAASKEDSFDKIKGRNILESFWEWLKKVLGI